MTYFTINEQTKEGRKLLAFLKTQPYIEILEEPNAVTKKAMKEAEVGKVKKAKDTDYLFRQIIG